MMYWLRRRWRFKQLGGMLGVMLLAAGCQFVDPDRGAKVEEDPALGRANVRVLTASIDLDKPQVDEPTNPDPTPDPEPEAPKPKKPKKPRGTAVVPHSPDESESVVTVTAFAPKYDVASEKFLAWLSTATDATWQDHGIKVELASDDKIPSEIREFPAFLLGDTVFLLEWKPISGPDGEVSPMKRLANDVKAHIKSLQPSDDP